MLSMKEMRILARDECIQMIGYDLVMEHKDLCCACAGMEDDGLFHYNLGVSLEESETEKMRKRGEIKGLLIRETPMDYYAFVVVNPETGEVIREYDISTLPEGK